MVRRPRRPSGPAARRGDRESGHVLIMALWVLVVLMFASALIAAGLCQRMELFRVEERTVRLTAQLDAALAQTLASLQRNRDYPGLEETPFGAGTIASEIASPDYDQRIVTVRATLGARSRAARAVVEIRGGFPLVREWKPWSLMEQRAASEE